MKISLRWALEHIAQSSIDSHFDVKELATKVNQSVVEIEHFSQLKLDPKKIFAAKIVSSSSDKTTFFCDELKETFIIKKQSNEPNLINDQVVLVKKNENGFDFLKLSDIGGDKDSLVPPVSMLDSQLCGSWKNEIFWEDIIFQVDNKSLTNRPDMWCHRGFAREFAMLLDAQLIPIQELLKVVPTICKSDYGQLREPSSGLCITVNSNSNCSYYAAISLKDFAYAPSNVKHVFNLARIGFKPINMIVDLTNYVCADWGQPMHAFDANAVKDNSIVIKEGIDGESMVALDGKEIILNSADIVVSDPVKAIALAGIIGSQESKITNSTKKVIIESATFNASTIRRSAFRHKIRTESSMRFEKTLDKTRAKEAIYRFMNLAKKVGLNFKLDSNLLCIGTTEEPLTIAVRHEFLEKKIGTGLSKNEVVKSLESLEFSVQVNDDIDYATIYEVTVPSWRLSKDIKIEEDIVEEVARCYGFNKIPPVLPNFTRQVDLQRDYAREIKNFLVYSMEMTEQYNYCFNDVDFFNIINQPSESEIFVLNPVNHNTKYLVKSLIPGLLKNVKTNFNNATELKFFEIANVWSIGQNSEILEKECFAGVFVNTTGNIDPLEIKSRLFKLFQFFGLNNQLIETVGINSANNCWEEKSSTNECFYNKTKFGKFGIISKKLFNSLEMPDAKGLFFEFDIDFLRTVGTSNYKYSPISKHPEQSFDTSILVQASSQALSFAKIIKDCSKFITEVKLVDSFEKPQWAGKKSLTYRVTIKGSDAALSREEVDSIIAICKDKLTLSDAQIR